MSKINDLYEQIIAEKINAVINSMQKGVELDNENHLNNIEIEKILKKLEQLNFKEHKHFIYDRESYDDYWGEPYYLEINDKNGPILFHEAYGTLFSKEKIIDYVGEEPLKEILALEKVDLEEITRYKKEINKSVQSYKEEAIEARENLIRAKLRESIKDAMEGKKQSEDNSLMQDNEIYVLLDMLKKAGLKQGKDFYFEEEDIEYNNIVPELKIRINDNLFEFSGMNGLTEIISIKEIEEFAKANGYHEPNVYAEWLNLKPIELEKLGINIDSQQTKTLKQQFEDSLLRDDVVDYYLSKAPEELEKEFGPEVSRMVGFEQKNAHHCYDLWGHTLHTVESIDTSNLTPEQVRILKVAAFFHDIGKPDVVGFNPRTKQQNFINHAVYSVGIAKPVLEKLGYTPEEIQQISFYIAHHDDFLNYKETLPDKDKAHIFFRETNPRTVEEIIVQNQINWDKLGINCYLPTHTGNPDVDKRNGDINNANNVKRRYICSTLVNGVEPEYRDFKNQPVKVDIDMEDIKAKLATGEYNADYIPTEEDYKMLIELCKADARAQSEKVITIDPKTQKEVISDTRERKVSTMQSIGQVIEIAYREGTDKISEATKKEIEELTGYSFEQFIKDSIPQTFGEKRPVVICKDGTEFSIQASSLHACSPRKDGLEAYDEFEIYALENWDGLEEFMNYDGVAGNVPIEDVKRILKAHGGIDIEKMQERLEKQKAAYQPKSDAYEKMISEMSGGNEFLEKMLRYATRKVEVRDKEKQAKQLYNEYEEQLPKDKKSLDDND